MNFSQAKPNTIFWFSHSMGWILAGLVLFISGLGHQSILSSLVRNGLFVIVGFSLSLALRYAYRQVWKKHESIFVSGIAAVGLSYLAGMISGFMLNPITFYAFRGGLGQEPFMALFAGVLNFAFVYMLWTAGYYGMKHYVNQLAAPKNPEKPTFLQRIPIDLSKKILLVKTEDITHIQADGDYIKIHTSDQSYLKRIPLSKLEASLDKSVFQRIHRSSIVNINMVSSLKPHINGEFFLVLSNGKELKLSRTYRHVLKSHLDADLSNLVSNSIA